MAACYPLLTHCKLTNAMKVLIVNSILYTPRTVGGGRYIPRVESIEDCMIVRLALEFVNQGHRVTLVAAAEYRPLKQQAFPFEIIYLPSAMSKLFQPTLLPFHPQLFRFIRKNREQYDMIISSEVFSISSLFAACLAPDKTLIWHEAGKHNRKFHKLPSWIWYNIVARTLMRKARVVARSAIAGRFVKQFGLRLTTDIVGHGVDGNIFHPQREKSPYFIVVAHLDKDKNVMSILQQYQKFIMRYPDEPYSLYIVGEGEESGRLKKYVKDNRLDKRILFLGKIPQKELSKYLANSACLLCNSVKELNMISIGEAVVTGTPVLTNTVPYSHEWIEEHKLGIVKDNWTEEDMREIVNNNSYYVDNCLHYSHELLLSELPGKFKSQFNT